MPGHLCHKGLWLHWEREAGEGQVFPWLDQLLPITAMRLLVFLCLHTWCHSVYEKYRWLSLHSDTRISPVQGTPDSLRRHSFIGNVHAQIFSESYLTLFLCTPSMVLKTAFTSYKLSRVLHISGGWDPISSSGLLSLCCVLLPEPIITIKQVDFRPGSAGKWHREYLLALWREHILLWLLCSCTKILRNRLSICSIRKTAKT